VLEVLEHGDIEVLGLLPYASNYTFLARARLGEEELLAIYKPSRGERPLWDFPTGTLAARERAAFLLSKGAGWDLVPPTVLRPDAPLGEGSVQLFIEHDPEVHYFTLVEERREDFAVFAAFDAVANNADRKSGHVLVDPTGKLWGVDHGLTFHVEDKLRTVIWDFAEEPLTPEVRTTLELLGPLLVPGSELFGVLSGVLSEAEATATGGRVAALLEAGSFPSPGTDRPVPWPLV
jgi:uncharacterized repeat protein (TIGR03843 family)